MLLATRSERDLLLAEPRAESVCASCAEREKSRWRCERRDPSSRVMTPFHACPDANAGRSKNAKRQVKEQACTKRISMTRKGDCRERLLAMLSALDLLLAEPRALPTSAKTTPQPSNNCEFLASLSSLLGPAPQFIHVDVSGLNNKPQFILSGFQTCRSPKWTWRFTAIPLACLAF